MVSDGPNDPNTDGRGLQRQKPQENGRRRQQKPDKMAPIRMVRKGKHSLFGLLHGQQRHRFGCLLQQC